MPGLPKAPLAERFDLNDDGRIVVHAAETVEAVGAKAE
jgi:hypothetical protein